MNAVPGTYHYHRIGHDERELELLPGGLIGTGAGGAEKFWELRNGSETPRLTIGGITARFANCAWKQTGVGAADGGSSKRCQSK